MVQPISKSIFNQKKPENLIHKTLNNISDGTIKLQQSPTKIIYQSINSKKHANVLNVIKHIKQIYSTLTEAIST